MINKTATSDRPPLTVGLPVTSERYWASFQVTRLFHKATVSHCDLFFCCYICICCLKLHQADYKVEEVFFFFFFFLTSILLGSTQLQCIYYLRRILISRPPRVFRRFKRRSCSYNMTDNYHNHQGLGLLFFSFFFKSWMNAHKFLYHIKITVETLYSTIYYSRYFIELNFDKSTQYVALWTHKRHPIPRPFGRAMECLLWVLEQKLIVL